MRLYIAVTHQTYSLVMSVEVAMHGLRIGEEFPKIRLSVLMAGAELWSRYQLAPVNPGYWEFYRQTRWIEYGANHLPPEQFPIAYVSDRHLRTFPEKRGLQAAGTLTGEMLRNMSTQLTGQVFGTLLWVTHNDQRYLASLLHALGPRHLGHIIPAEATPFMEVSLLIEPEVIEIDV
jgi:hypothetical protein